MYLLYFVLWVAFAGAITLEICIFGLVIAALIFAFTCKFMDHSIEKEISYYKKSLRFLKYLVILMDEIRKANIQTIKMILSKESEIKPVLVDFETDLQTEKGKVMLTNSITLTPGTITVSLDKSKYTVHCLDKSMAPGMDESIFVEEIRKLEK